MKKKVYVLSVFVCLYSCTNQKEKTETEEKKATYCLTEQLKKTTEIIPILEKPIHEQLSLSGKIEYNENDLVSFKSLLQGVVDKVNFELSDYVQKGQVLAVVKSNEVLELTQQKRFIQNQLELSRKQLKTKKELLADGMISQQDVIVTEHEIQLAQIELDKLNATLGMYRAVGNGQFQILAPKNGYIVQKNMSVGQSITADSEAALFSISNLKQVWVMVNIYANNLQYVKQGDNVKVKTMAYPDRIYSGKIDKIYNVFDDNEHVLKARVVLDNSDLNLMPGLSAEIIIDKQNVIGNGFAVPNNAIVFENNKEYIVVYTNDCHLKIRKITTIAANEEYTFVEEKFAPNEKVVTKNALLIYEELNK